jgi:YD repeat-containing protein
VTSFLRLFVLGLLLALAHGAALAETKVWEVHSGDPCCGIPDENYKYMDADEACQSLGLPPDNACSTNHKNLRSSVTGTQTSGVCLYDYTCTCESCSIGPPPYNFVGVAIFGVVTSTKVRTCGADEPYLGTCDAYPPKAKGECPDCDPWQANPVNVGPGNKFQRETTYKAASGGLELTLSYNSKAGNSYFRTDGAFGGNWTSPYFVRLRNSKQGIIAVNTGSGRELEFRQPASGNVYTAQADITDRLERVVDGSGQIVSWTLTSANGDRIEEHDGPASLQRGYVGTLTRIRDRALLEHTMTYSTTPTPTAPKAGLLTAVTDPFGRQLTFTYDAKRRVVTMTDPGGGVYAFEYDGPTGPADANNLTKITFPDGRTRVYYYAETANINGGAPWACSPTVPGLANLLTGIQDENGVRFATWTYDCFGRPASSQHAGGVNQFTFTYPSGSRVVTDPLGTQRTIGIQRTLHIGYSTGTQQPAASGSGTVSTSRTRDAQGNLASHVDFNGNRTNYTYDLARNLETSRTEGLTAGGAATPQTRTISTTWHSTFRLPTGIAEPLRITTFSYDADGTTCGARGALCSKSIQATTDANGSQAFSATSTGSPRTWTYTYNSNGSVLTVNGPRTDVSDVTTYTYYANNDADAGKRGNVATITNAAGHTTSITAYNAHGQPLTIVDANGMTTTMTYDARQRLKTRTVGGETTTYDYDGAGQLTRVTLPDGSYLSYTYDGAHRLTGMEDSLGNRVIYTLDNRGNRTHEQVYDPASQLAQTRTRVYNNLNRLFQEIGAASQVTEYTYDDHGNVLTVKNPLNHVTTNQYDALNRLKQVTSPAPISAVTQYGYDGIDQLVSVTDPRSLVTTYAVNGLGNQTQLSSPDTGTTTKTYDLAGNVLTQTDAKSQTTTYAYDALNRVTSITFHDGSKHHYTYDSGTNGIGRLTGIAELDPALTTIAQIAYGYDQKGRVLSEARTVNGVAYTTAYRYDSAGRLDQLTYPSGRTVEYGFDAAGRISGIATTPNGGSTRAIAAGITYHPFGGVKGFTLANGQTYARTYDQDGRAATYTLGGTAYTIGYDAASRIAFITETANPPNTNTYGYDNVDRLTSATLPASVYGFGYDGVGNRVTRSTGSGSDTYAYSSTSNQLSSITPVSGPARTFTFDANGSTTADSNNTYGYDTRGRMVSATSSLGTTTYHVNALGQRVRKTNSVRDTVFTYDTGGRLLVEHTAAGVLKREYIYLQDIPVAVVVQP